MSKEWEIYIGPGSEVKVADDRTVSVDIRVPSDEHRQWYRTTKRRGRRRWHLVDRFEASSLSRPGVRGYEMISVYPPSPCKDSIPLTQVHMVSADQPPEGVEICPKCLSVLNTNIDQDVLAMLDASEEEGQG
jgi:hypothetical protein